MPQIFPCAAEMVCPICIRLARSLNSHHCRAIISAADGGDGVESGAGISSMSHQTHEEECLESTSPEKAAQGSSDSMTNLVRGPIRVVSVVNWNLDLNL